MLIIAIFSQLNAPEFEHRSNVVRTELPTIGNGPFLCAGAF